MKHIITTLLFVFVAFTSFAFDNSDSIVIKKASMTYFFKDGVRIKPGKLINILKPNEQAYQQMRWAKTNYDIGYLFGFFGGGAVGYFFGNFITGGEPNYKILAVGGGLLLISIPLNVAYTRRAIKAVNIYNAGINKTSYNHIDVNIGFALNGIKLKMNF